MSIDAIEIIQFSTLDISTLDLLVFKADFYAREY